MQGRRTKWLLAATALTALTLSAQPGTAAGPDFAEFADTKAKDIKPQDVISWDGFQASEQADGAITVTLRMNAKDDWKVYAHNLKFGAPSGFILESVAPPPAKKFMDPISNSEVDIYEGGEFSLKLNGAPRWTREKLPVTATYVGCTNVICLFPFTQTIEVAFVPFAAKDSAAAAAPVLEGDDLETKLAKQFKSGDLTFSTLLLIVFLGGLLSNLTPCVAPMVPITLRLLARQGASPYRSATAYAAGIVVTYSLLGLVAALSGGLFGSLLASKAFNLSFAAVMMGLGVTMLGFGDFSKLQMLGNRLGGGKPSLKNTFLMGTGAGLVAAPCTGPILAALLAYTAKNNAGVGPSTVLLGTYSLGFALPYVALGGAAAKVSGIRVSPLLQVGVKLLFASVMFGLGLYYLRIPLYGLVAELKAYWPMVAAVGLGVGLVLCALWLVLPNLQNSKGSMILPTAVLGVGLFAASQWATSRGHGEGGLTWHHSEADAFAAAAQSGKPILIDMWAEWCEACKKMDGTTFADPEVTRALAENWVLLKLDLTESTPTNDEIQTRYTLQSLPTLVLLPPSAQLQDKHAINGYVTSQALINDLHQFSQKRAE